MGFYLKQPRRPTNRMTHWDYSGDGIYYITIVTNYRICNLGDIIDGKMILSDFGKIVDSEWTKSFIIINELHLEEYVIMPNHIHSIIKLEKQKYNLWDGHSSSDLLVGAHGRAPLREDRGNTANDQGKPVRKPKSISSFIAGFKSSVTTRIDDFIDLHDLDMPKYNRFNHFFQPNYHDRLIRNQDEFVRLKRYIINNPRNWKKDIFNL